MAQGFTRFGVAGTCSGAYLAFHAAVADERLSCVVAVNLNRFVWPHDLSVENSVRHVYQPSAVYARKAADPRTLLRVLKGEVDAIGIARALGGRLATRLRARAAGLLNRAVGERGARSAGTPRGWLHRLAERRARLLFVFTSQDAGLDEIDKHFGSLARLAALPGVKTAMVDNADHNFSPQWARDQLIALLTDFAAAAPCGGFDAPGPQP